MSTSSKTEPGELPESVLVGEILRPHGVRGEVLAAELSDAPDRFEPGAELTLVPREGSSHRVRVERMRRHRGRLVLALAGIGDRAAAAALAGARLEVARAAVPEAPAGAYYHFELVGCRCRDRRAGDLGRVVAVVADGGGWLVVAEREDGFRLAMPFVERFVVAIDRAARTIDWDLPEGLIETCASRS